MIDIKNIQHRSGIHPQHPDQFLYQARLFVLAEQSIDKTTLERHAMRDSMKERIREDLSAAIMSNIYGDFKDPIMSAIAWIKMNSTPGHHGAQKIVDDLQNVLNCSLRQSIESRIVIPE